MSALFSSDPRRRTIGLTGGIASGKTTVSNYLANVYHLPIFDADLYAREAVAPGSKILLKIGERYGSRIFRPDGSLDRLQLGNIIFHNVVERHWLEQQIHPYVRDRLLDAAKIPATTIVLTVPLLFEANLVDLCTEVWVVYCSPTQQLERLMLRDRLSLEQATARINSQMSLEEKRLRADVILDNSSSLDLLLKQVDTAVTQVRSESS